MGDLYERAKRQAEKGADFKTILVDAEVALGHSPLSASEAAELRDAWRDSGPGRKKIDDRRAAAIAPGRNPRPRR